MKTTAIYVRVSTERQSQAQTIEQQVDRLQEHLKAKGQALSDNQIFRDDGYSGASLNRPGLDQLRDQVKRACFERVLITSPDRLARRFVHQILLIEEWERTGVEKAEQNEVARALTPRGLDNVRALARLFGFVRYFYPSEEAAWLQSFRAFSLP